MNQPKNMKEKSLGKASPLITIDVQTTLAYTVSLLGNRLGKKE